MVAVFVDGPVGGRAALAIGVGVNSVVLQVFGFVSGSAGVAETSESRTTHGHELVAVNRSHVRTSLHTASKTLKLLPCFGLDDLARLKEHRVDVVNVHLLKLGVVELLSKLRVSLSVDRILHRVVPFGNTIDSVLAILDTDKRTNGAHRTHRCNNRLIFASVSLVNVLLIFHHLIPIFATRFARSNGTHVLGNCHI